MLSSDVFSDVEQSAYILKVIVANKSESWATHGTLSLTAEFAFMDDKKFYCPLSGAGIICTSEIPILNNF
jgi:hypothetical protein